MQKIKRYRSKIFVYSKRRDAFRIKAKARLAKYTGMIKVWNQGMKRLQNKVKKVKELIKETNEYFNVDIRKEDSRKQTVLARNCFFKYAMDKKMEGSMLVEVLGFKHPAKAYRDRKRFIQSFQNNPKNKETYHQFKKYIESQKNNLEID